MRAALDGEHLLVETTTGQPMLRTSIGSEESNNNVTALTRMDTTSALSKQGLSTKYVLTHCAHGEKPGSQDKNLEMPSRALANPHILEQFSSLWTRLRQTSAKQALKTLVITSSIPGEGKTFVTRNLAEFIARHGNRPVLMIDADMRHRGPRASMPSLCLPGLTDYLNGGIDEMAVIQRGQNENLFLIRPGRPVKNTSELLGNGQLQVLFDRIGSAFEWILLDCPPCLALADVSVIADACDGALLVVNTNATSASLVHKACQELKSRNLAGIVLNAPETRSESTAHGQAASSSVPADSTSVTFSFRSLEPAMD